MNYPTNRLLAGVLKMVCALVLGAAATTGFATETPMSLEGGTMVTADQAKKLVDAGAPIIDARVANEYAEAHIKGAKSVPYKERSGKVANFDPKDDRFDVAKLPADKAAKTAVGAGYTKVQWLRGGIPEWKAKGYPVE